LGNALADSAPAEARALAERTLADLEGEPADRDGDRARALQGLGIALEALEEPVPALAAMRRSNDLMESAHGPDDWRLGYGLSVLGQMLVQHERPAEAIAPLERALAIRERASRPSHEIGQTRYWLARAAAGTGDVARARSLVATARTELEAAGTTAADVVADLDAWRDEALPETPPP
jgi:hypothetical protein